MNPPPIRVLVIDDSAVVRRLVTDALAHDPAIEVVGTALDPLIARDKIVALKPDVLTLDIEMPRMDGLTFLRLLMKERPMPVIVMSSLSQQGSHQAFEALRLGAVDVLGKPGGAFSFGDLGPQLVEKIKAAAVARIRRRTAETDAPWSVPAVTASPAPAPTPAAAPKPAPQRARSSSAPPKIAVALRATARADAGPALRVAAPLRHHHPKRLILLGASTGGTEALREVLTRLPGDLPPIAIVQHIPAMFSRAFADRLNALCALEVREAVDGDKLVPGLALIAPGNYHLLVQWHADGYRARVVQGPAVWHQRPAVDLLFKSAVEAAGSHAIAGVLTGMGKDGAEGLLRLKENGAQTFSQDEDSSVVYGMPRAAWELGGSQVQVPLGDIADHIVQRVDAALPAVARA